MIKSKAANQLSAELAASALLKWFGVSAIHQIDVEAIAWGRGVRVRQSPLDGVEAWLLRSGKHGIIRINDGIREQGRRRFSIAHELGHWEMHAQLSQEWLCTSADIHAYRGSPQELEANAFAASLLMPEKLIRPRIQSGVNMALVVTLAEEFGTTLTATAVRCVELADEDLFIVFSNGGKVRWWRQNPRGSELFIHVKDGLHTDSMALWCEQQPRNAPDMERVPLHAWFWPPKDGEDREVWEQSSYLPQYDTVLTLLCVI